MSPSDANPRGHAELPEDLSDDADALYHQAPFGYVSTHLDWTIFKVNRTLLDLLGLDREQVVGRRFPDLLAVGDRIYHETHYAPLLHLQGAVKEVSAHLIGAGDTPHPVLIRSDVVSDERRGVSFIRTGVVDISDRQRYEEELLRERHRAEASEARERTLRKALAELAAAVTTDDIVEVLEGFAAGVIGDGEVAVWLLSEDGRTLERPGSAPGTGRLDTDGSTIEARALRSAEVIEDPDGRTLAVSLRAGSRILGVLTARPADRAPLPPHGRDLLLSLGQQAGQALERGRLYEDKDRMLGMVAHDLRTPLTTIGGFAQTLQRFLATDLEPAAAHALERIVHTTQRLARLTDDLLDTSVLRLGHLALDRIWQPVGPVVMEAAAAHRPIAAEKDIPLRLRDHSAAAQALVDADRLIQVVDNLVSNALKYSPSGEPVTVTVTAEPGSIRVEVEDHGPGIARSELPGLFSAFAQTRNQPTGGEESTGLGLAIARDLIDAHGGDLRVETEEGAGSTFSFWVPRDTPTEPAAERDRHPVPGT